jgi:hypothetical protein
VATALADALASETRLLGELIAILRRQRAAVGADDFATVDDSVFATQRVLHTLGEARRRRQALYRALGVPDDAGPRALADAMGLAVTPELRAALDGLVAAAQALAAEVALNRSAIRAALR